MQSYSIGTPTIWNLGFMEISGYSLMFTLGMIATFLSALYFWIRQKYSWEHFCILTIIIVPSSIIGARLWYLISAGGWSTFYILSGMSIHGGILGAVLSITPYIYIKRKILDIRIIASIVLPNLLLGQAIGRWGNFFNHEIFGPVIKNDWLLNWMGSLKNHMNIDASGNTAFRHPFFLYESIASFIGYLFLTWILLRKNYFKPGVTGSFYLLWYGLVRICMEPLRDSLDILKWGALPISVFVSAIFILIGFITFIWFEFFTKIFSNKTQIEKYLDSKDKKIIKNTFLFIYEHLKNNKYYLIHRYPKKKYIFFDPLMKNQIKIWKTCFLNDKAWTKKEINQGFKKL